MIEARLKEKDFAVVLKGVSSLPAAVLQAGARGLARALLQTAGVVQNQYLTGPRPAHLAEVTGRLRKSITTEVTQTADNVIGKIGSNVPYAAFHEFGFVGVQNVRQHLRFSHAVNASGAPVEIRPRPIRDREGAIVGYKENFLRAAKRAGRAGQVSKIYAINVRAHTRQINYAGRPFIFPALQQSWPLIVETVKTALAEAGKTPT